MSSKPRKPTGSFVNDPSAINLIQLSPRTELFQLERSPYTMANHSSKTNFIGDSVLPEGPRAVAVSETGEKHSIHLEEDNPHTTNLNPFSSVTSQCSQLTSLQTHMTSATKVPSGSNEYSRLISSKRSKSSRRHSNSKPRPIFTPRNMDKIVPRFFNEDAKLKNPLHNVQTQTDTNASHSTSPLTPRVYHSPPIVPPLQMTRRYVPRESAGDMLDTPRRQPLRILPREKKPFKNFAGNQGSMNTSITEELIFWPNNFRLLELRSIASALTLITVVSWLFSIFFELEGICDMFTGLCQLLSSWYTKSEQPMTKMEMLVQFARDLWS